MTVTLINEKPVCKLIFLNVSNELKKRIKTKIQSSKINMIRVDNKENNSFETNSSLIYNLDFDIKTEIKAEYPVVFNKELNKIIKNKLSDSAYEKLKGVMLDINETEENDKRNINI